VFVNFFGFTLQDTGMRINVYIKATAQAQDLLDAIVLQLGEETN
jgi:hypothetical protein